MSGSVTVPGADGSEVTGIFGNGSNFAIAQQISLALAAANEAGTLSVTTVSGSESIPEPLPARSMNCSLATSMAGR